VRRRSRAAQRRVAQSAGGSPALVLAGGIALLALGVLTLALVRAVAPPAVAPAETAPPAATPVRALERRDVTPTPTDRPQPRPTSDTLAATRQAAATIVAQEQADAGLRVTLTAIAPLAPTVQAVLPVAAARYAPAIDALLLEHGYRANIIDVAGLRGLRASQRNYSNSVWTRDLDYAISGYGLALGDLSVFAENIALFMGYVTADGVAPETIYLRGDRLDAENRTSWDSMPNLIHAAYVYVAKTGDRSFYEQYRGTLLTIGAWIVRLDSDGDGMPDQDIFPYGYYDSIENGPLHTYALARFYGAFLELAELEAWAGHDGARWREHAAALRSGYHRPVDAGGYWLTSQPWPIAWRRGDGRIVPILETFGVFAALRSGLLDRDDPQYAGLVAALQRHLADFLADPAPFRLTLGGYEPEMRRVVDPPVPLWMLDASAPWIVGLAAPAYAAAGLAAEAEQIMGAYRAMVADTDPPVLEFIAGDTARYGPGESGDRGRTWDSAAWFLAIYGGHYGLQPTPARLIVAPRPFRTIPGDGITGFSYQGARIDLLLDAARARYIIRSDQPVIVELRPLVANGQVRVDDGPARPSVTRILAPARDYVVASVP
jgi:hypothetical protein